MHQLAAHPLVEDLLQRAKLAAKLDRDAWTKARFDESLKSSTIAQWTRILAARPRGDRYERDEKGALASLGVPQQRRVFDALTDALHGAIIVAVLFRPTRDLACSAMFRRRSPETSDNRLDALEDAVRELRREAAEMRAAHDDAIDLALIHAVPNAVHGLIMEARVQGWSISYSRGQRREQYGTIHLGHPSDDAHDCSIELPLPEDPAAHRQLESDIGMRIRWTRAA